MKKELGDRQDLVERLTPDYPPFVRRPVVDNNWYRSLARKNVELVTDDIVRFTPDGIETADGKVRKIDAIVTATGFEVAKYLAPMKFKGKDGLDLQKFWAPDGPARLPEYDGAAFSQYVHALRP